MKVIAIAQHKGGTGKTTTTLNLGLALERLGYRVVMIDMDSQANLTTCLIPMWGNEPDMVQYMTGKAKVPIPVRICDHPNLFILPSSLDMIGIEQQINSLPGRDMILSRLIKKLPAWALFHNDQKHIDFVLIDCPPSMNVLTINALMACDEILVPMPAEVLPFKGLDTLEKMLVGINEITDMNLKISGILLTMFNWKTVMNRDILEVLKTHYKDVLLSTHIRRNIALSEAIGEMRSVFDYSPKSSGAMDYMAFTEEYLNRFGRPEITV